MKKKKIIPLIALVAVLAGLVGLLVFLTGQEADLQEQPEQDDRIYITGGPDLQKQPEQDDQLSVTGGPDGLTISRVEVNNPENTFTVIRTMDENKPVYTIEGMEDLPVNNATLGTLVTNAASLEAKSVVAERDGDLALYGLDSPRATVKVVAEEESPVLLLGNDAPGGEGIYLMREGDEAVYLVRSTSAERWLWNVTEVLDLKMTDGDESVSMNRIELSGTVRPTPIVLEKEEQKEGEEATFAATHVITSPIEAEADISVGLQAMTTAFGVRAESAAAIYPDEKALEEFGLAEPYSVISTSAVTTAGDPIGPFTLSVSEPDEEGMAYALVSTKPNVVYRVDAAGLEWLELNVFDIMSKMLVLPFIDTVGTITVSSPGEAYEFILTGEGDDLEVTCNGTELELSSFRQFYQTLIGVRYREEVTEEVQLGEPILEFTYAYRDGGGDAIRFYSGGARRMLVSLNGAPPHTVESTYVDYVLDSVEKLLAGETVKSYI